MALLPDLIALVLPIAHETGAAHQETAADGGDGNTIAILAGVLATLVLLVLVIRVQRPSRPAAAGDGSAAGGTDDADGDA